MKSPFRYPGSKAKLSTRILQAVPDAPGYVDLFVGGGSMLLALAKAHPTARLLANDADPRVFAFWNYIATSPDTTSIEDKIDAFQPSLGGVVLLRMSPVDEFTALGLNRCTFSGILDASPIGGADQKVRSWSNGKTPVSCRYNPKALKNSIRAAHYLLHGRLSAINEDFSNVFVPPDWHVYADPPYFVKGSMLYKQRVDHDKLATWLKSKGNFTLSYDNAPEVLRLYKDCHVTRLPVRYCIQDDKQTWDNATELLIQGAA